MPVVWEGAPHNISYNIYIYNILIFFVSILTVATDIRFIRHKKGRVLQFDNSIKERRMKSYREILNKLFKSYTVSRYKGTCGQETRQMYARNVN